VTEYLISFKMKKRNADSANKSSLRRHQWLAKGLWVRAFTKTFI